jgi:hypothetical protein
MNKVLEILHRKPLLFLFITLGYLIVVGFIKWQIHPPLVALWYLLGGAIGVYFLDAAEVFFALNPSPFRSIVFVVAFVILSFFVVTSSGSLLAIGLVLALYINLILWQIGQWQYEGNLNSWYRMIAGSVSPKFQQWGLVIFVALFFVETILFLRWS